MELTGGQNQPIWVSVYVPPQTPPGEYRGEITVHGEQWQKAISIRLHVWDFSLPEKTHLKTAIGFDPAFVKQYHHCNDPVCLDSLLKLYYRHFAQHRISPFEPFSLKKKDITFDDHSLTVAIDFSDFDRDYDFYVKELGFNTFRLRVMGLPSGTPHHYSPGVLDGYGQNSPQYKALMESLLGQLQDHLDSLDALDKAYIYWFDEPTPENYPCVIKTMKLIKNVAPKIKRMLTEQPDEGLFGHVDIWCPISHRFQYEVARERKKEDEHFWWYLCTHPRTPFATLFIDHYAVELRTWIWQTWKYQIDGILIWKANYWTSPDTGSRPYPQNPWEDPMSYQRGKHLKPNQVAYWGNGDGRFIYPPKAVFQSDSVCLQGPVSSIRWEMLREGLEDYEMLWLLDSVVSQLDAKYHQNLIDQAKELLKVPDTITASLTQFSKSAEPILAHRKKCAVMIEQLQTLVK